MTQEEYVKLKELGKLRVQLQKNLINLFNSKIESIDEHKEEVIKKYANAYLNYVKQFLENPNYRNEKGKITTRDENNIFGNYNISGDENSSYYEIYKDCMVIVLKFDKKEDIKFNSNEDLLLYDELRINDLLYEYGIDVQSRNKHPQNVINILYYKDKSKLEKNSETAISVCRLYTRKRDH